MNAQQLILGHLLPITVAIAVLWLVYRLLFVNSNRLKFNRIFLLVAMLFSLALPLIGPLMSTSAPQVAVLKDNFVKGFILSEITITPDGVQPMTTPEIVIETASRPHFTLWQIFAGIYLIGVGVMTLLFLFKLGKLIVMIVRSPKEKREGYTAVYLSADPEPVEGPQHGSFSFLRYAIFPNKEVSEDIVRHEMSHIAHHHSADIIFAELMIILQWFNPFIYRYKKELQSIHEYQADRDVVATGVDKKDYMMLILQQCTAADFSGMSNNFSLILTKKRIKMITKNEKAKGLWWRLLATLPVLAVLMIANTKVAAQEQKSDPINKDVLTVQMGDFELFNDDGTQMQLKDTIIYYEDGSYTKFESSEAIDPFTGEMRKTFKATTCQADGTPNPNVNFTIREVEKHGDTMVYSMDPFIISADKLDKIKISTDEDMMENIDTIYQVVEEMPEFPGGVEAMIHYVGDNVKYPKEAKDKEIQGRVFISFVVEKDGSVNEVKVERGIGGGCDEEAVRVISAMPKWKPGKQKGECVRVSYMMPIVFKLTDDQPNRPDKKSDVGKADMKPDKNGVYQIVEEMPKFPGGEQAMMKFVAENVKYPEKAIEANISGRVFVSFVVEKDGSISEVKVERGIGGGCDEEAVRVIKSMPKWTPGKMEGKPVRVSYMMPINYKLDNSQKSQSNSLAGTIWEGIGTGTKDGVTYTWHSIMQFTSENEGLFIEKLVSQKKNGQPEVVFENVAMDFEYAFDGKKTGAITPKNGDGTYMDELPPEGFVLSDDGKTIVFHFYTAKEDTGIEYVTYTRR